ncbi:TrkH family potassium uptake protein [Desulfopila sp. IMCC35006]|uniref:TrkH family potassium uptake protein n=1 Tax=Desulfopila sp. IMCC35006 TaxID=2569542 RepID=UPI00142F1D50|nr:potassium transporter TrkG [Desulfopila sp. IMCC35006]
MKVVDKYRQSTSRIGMEGALMALSPLPFLLLLVGGGDAKPYLWQVTIAWISAPAAILSGLILFTRPFTGKICGAIALVGTFTITLPWLMVNPFAALTGAVTLIGASFVLIDLPIDNGSGQHKQDILNRYLEKARWAAVAVPCMALLCMLTHADNAVLAVYCITGSFFIAQGLAIHWAMMKKSLWHLIVPTAGSGALGWAFFSSFTDRIPAFVLLFSLLGLLALPRSIFLTERREHLWEILMNHPARILLSTFSALGVLGTALLSLPIATTKEAIHLVDAAFTSVSAVCVTGLIVLDTPNDFTLYGQIFILLLIQLGGLGIMSITTVALHAMGRRLSLKQERLLTSITDTDHNDLVHSLRTILKFTFIAEATGASLLTMLFIFSGAPPGEACWRGLFTSISAFCNAGFALQSDNLLSYQTNPLILHVVATLIIFGGLAPATSLVIPRWLSGKHLPIPARIALITTCVLLVSGTFFILAFEWNGVLAGLSIADKVHNAWFQSVTLRTAGFNSVDIAQVTNPTFLVMLGLMFIGGSPGGTAGGVKTTTVGILAMTFWAKITNRDEILIHNRSVRSATVYQAITIVTSGMIVWFTVVLMLEMTQQISVRNIIFETTSALGTVGLSTGATPLLDEIGKILIMIAMFVGRIGPMTLFMLLSNDQVIAKSRSPHAKIPLT